MTQHSGPKDRPPKNSGKVLNLDQNQPIKEATGDHGITLARFLEHASNLASMDGCKAQKKSSGQVSTLANLKREFKLKSES